MSVINLIMYEIWITYMNGKEIFVKICQIINEFSSLYFKRSSANIDFLKDSKYLKHFNLFPHVWLFSKLFSDFTSEMNVSLCHLIIPFIRATNVPIVYYRSYILHQRYCHERKILDIDISIYFELV